MTKESAATIFTVIETKRLILKGLSPENMKYIFENCSKPEIKKILGHRSEEDYQKEANKHTNGYSTYNRSFKLFLMIDKASDSIIGRCGIHNWNAEHRRGEIGYVIEDENYKKKGLMTETLAAVIEYGFNKMNLNRIEALVSTGNVPSLRLMKKFNFIREGLLRQHYYVVDKYEDSVMFSKLYLEYINDQNK
jgi:[ribosomal protein S5]-alanine N-acetyltransferase